LFFFTLKKGTDTPYRRVPSQKSPESDTPQNISFIYSGYFYSASSSPRSNFCK